MSQYVYYTWQKDKHHSNKREIAFQLLTLNQNNTPSNSHFHRIVITIFDITMKRATRIVADGSILKRYN
ncbi:hypothetical protein [Ornithinibacillus massiliensis]|uniref:hypothetical protein n=1 Tax=Ornithinibacillus massiliensis TaxID=1944633 RepID=UPI001BA5C64D|nr:hypothetical protein [Ornithinibacillus massiliensis]